jgi:putative hydrolase of the HAD superfamily
MPALMASLKAILFDLDDTLYSTSEFASLARLNALRAMIRMGLKVPLDVLSRELSEVVREFGSNFGQHYGTLLKRLPSESYKDINPVLLVASAVAAYHDTKRDHLAPHQDAMRLLKALTKTRLIRGVVSDGLQVKQAEKLLRLGIYPLLSPGAVFISEQMGISKPNPKIFSKACRKLGVPAGQALYVGNSMSQDIAPAAAAGLHTVFTRRGGREDDPSASPEHSIDNFDELRQILRKVYGVRIG